MKARYSLQPGTRLTGAPVWSHATGTPSRAPAQPECKFWNNYGEKCHQYEIINHFHADQPRYSTKFRDKSCSQHRENGLFSIEICRNYARTQREQLNIALLSNLRPEISTSSFPDFEKILKINEQSMRFRHTLWCHTVTSRPNTFKVVEILL